MPSPFPGMNPYLEAYAWRDFHTAFNVALRTALRRELGNRYVVLVEEDLIIHEPPASQRRRMAVADVALAERAGGSGRRGRAGAEQAAAVVEAPAQVTIALDAVEERHRHVRILDRRDQRVVTVIELLSPSNLHDDGRALYLNKRQQYIRAGANLVEIHLLRGGRPMPMEPGPATPYYVLVAKAGMEKHDLWPIGLRDPLPPVPVPLLPPDPDTFVDLQSLLHQVFDQTDYGSVLYDAALDPPLSADDEAWVRQVLQGAKQAEAQGL